MELLRREGAELEGPAPRALVCQVQRECVRRLLEGDLGAGLLELLLGGLSVLLLGSLDDDLGSSLDGVLSLLQTIGGQSADDLDDGDLVGAERGQLDVEVGLLLGRRRVGDYEIGRASCRERV